MDIGNEETNLSTGRSKDKEKEMQNTGNHNGQLTIKNPEIVNQYTGKFNNFNGGNQNNFNGGGHNNFKDNESNGGENKYNGNNKFNQ